MTGFDERPDGVTVHLADGTTAEADLLIGADGVHSRVREQLLPGSHAEDHAWRLSSPRATHHHRAAS